MKQIKHSSSQGYVAVTILGFAFMVMFIAYNSLQNMISSLYQQIGYHSLGQIALFGIYTAASIGHFAAAYVIQRVSYKKLMFWCSVLYVIFELTGLLVAKCKTSPHDGICNKSIVYLVVILGSLICGTGASFIWVAQGAYVTELAVGDTKGGQLFGLFWGWKSGSQIFGAIITTFVLGNLSQMTYFIILSALGLAGSFTFLFLRPTGREQERDNQPKITLSEGFKEMISLICQKGTLTQKLYYIFAGVSLACYTGFLYKLINRSYKQQQGQDIEQYHKQLKFHTGLVLIVLGISLVVSGIIMNRIKERISQYRMFYIGTVIVECAALVSLLTYFLQSYGMCYLCAILWGASDICLQSTATAYVAKQYMGKPAAFSVLRTFITIGVASFLLINIIFTELHIPEYVFMLVVLGFQSVMTSFGNTEQKKNQRGIELAQTS